MREKKLYLAFVLVALSISVGSACAQQGVKISEILFNPVADGVDYLELYNDGGSSVPLRDIRLAQWKSESISKLYLLDTSRSLAPNDYIVVTTDAAWVKRNYIVRYPEKLVEVKSMPSYNNASGTVVICDADSAIIDRFDYTENMHSRLLRDVEGVALERRAFDRPTQDSANWFSASSTSGYGTPTYANSQSREFLFEENNFVVEPELFSPDNDGYNDLLNITYNLNDEDLDGNVFVVDKNGRVVRHLMRGGLLGTNGLLVWDGLDESGQRCRQGRYVLVVEAYDTQGRAQRVKKVVSLVSGH